MRRNLLAVIVCCLMLIGVSVAGETPPGIAFVETMPIRGLKSFSELSLRESLSSHVEMIAVSQGSLDVRRATACQLVKRSLLNRGFPDVKVEFLETGELSITEGPRFRMGELQIHGASEAFEATLRDQIKTTSSIGWKRTSQGVQDMNRGTDRLNWKPGEFICFTDDTVQAWQSTLRLIAQAEGRQGADFLVKLERYAELFHLSIEVVQEGQPLLIDDIQFDGLKNHSPEEMLEFLKIPLGPITQLNQKEILSQLQESGRFLLSRVEMIPPFREGDPHHLLITVKEANGVPRLSESLSPEQEALLRFRKWMETFNSQDHQLRFEGDFSVPIPNPFFDDKTDIRLSIVLSPHDEVIACVRTVSTDAPTQGIVIRMGPEDLAIGSLRSRRVCTWKSQFKTWLGLSFHLCATEASTFPPSNVAVQMGYAFSSTKKKSGLNVKIEPAALLDSPAEKKWEFKTENDQVSILAQHGRLTIDSGTGRLIELLVEDSGRQVRFSSEPDSLDATWNSWLSENQMQVIDAGDLPFTHLTELLFAEWDLARPENAVAHRAIMKLIRPDTLPGIDRYIRRHAEQSLPSIRIGPTDISLSSIVQQLVLDYERGLVRSDSTAAATLKNCVILRLFSTKASCISLAKSMFARDCGPLTCGLMALGCHVMMPSCAPNFRELGRSKLTDDKFQTDLAQWVDAEHGIGFALIQASRRLRDLTPEESECLSKWISDEPVRSSMVQLIAELQQLPDLESNSLEIDRLRGISSKYWDPLIRPALQAALDVNTDPVVWNRADGSVPEAVPEPVADHAPQTTDEPLTGLKFDPRVMKPNEWMSSSFFSEANFPSAPKRGVAPVE